MNIVPIAGPRPEIIEALEALLDDAKQGNLLGLVIVARETCGVSNCVLVGDLPAYETLGAIEVARLDFISASIDTE